MEVGAVVESWDYFRAYKTWDGYKSTEKNPRTLLLPNKDGKNHQNSAKWRYLLKYKEY